MGQSSRPRKEDCAEVKGKDASYDELRKLLVNPEAEQSFGFYFPASLVLIKKRLIELNDQDRPRLQHELDKVINTLDYIEKHSGTIERNLLKEISKGNELTGPTPPLRGFQVGEVGPGGRLGPRHATASRQLHQGLHDRARVSPPWLEYLSEQADEASAVGGTGQSFAAGVERRLQAGLEGEADRHERTPGRPQRRAAEKWVCLVWTQPFSSQS